MTGTRYPDMVSISDCYRPAPKVNYAREAPEYTEGDVMDYIPACPDYTDVEIGQMVRLACDGMTSAEIGELMGLTSHEVSGKLLALKKGLEAGGIPRRNHHATGNRKGRPTTVTDAQRERVDSMRSEGFTIPVIMAATGLKDGQVRWLVSRDAD